MEKRAYWDEENKSHIAKHDVTPHEVNFVLARAEPPFPEELGDGKYVVRGQTEAGRLLQVIFVYRLLETLDWNVLDWEDRMALLAEDAEEVVYPIHARDLTDAEKRALRRRLK